MSPQNADGTPHFAYYDLPTLTSFIWDGRSFEVEVSVGGYGEPVVDTIPVDWGGRSTADGHLQEFQRLCDSYVLRTVRSD